MFLERLLKIDEVRAFWRQMYLSTNGAAVFYGAHDEAEANLIKFTLRVATLSCNIMAWVFLVALINNTGLDVGSEEKFSTNVFGLLMALPCSLWFTYVTVTIDSEHT